MLSRTAKGIYWIGRCLERAQHSCRLLADQLEALEDRTVEEIDRTWRRLYIGLGRTPVGGDLESNWGDEGFMLADAYTLTDDLTFEPNNPESIRGCLAVARENAREVRNIIGKDMWSCLNVAHLGLRNVGIEDIWNDRPGEFYLRIEDTIRTFSGIAESTMYRDDSWHCLGVRSPRLGRREGRHVAALIVCPHTIPPSEWLPGVWDSHIGFEDAEGTEATIAAVMGHYSRIARELAESPEDYAPVLGVDADSGESLWEPWIGGFERGMRLRRAVWRQIARSDDRST